MQIDDAIFVAILVLFLLKQRVAGAKKQLKGKMERAWNNTRVTTRRCYYR